MSTSKPPVPVLFPVFDDNTEDIAYRRHTIALAKTISEAIGNYLNNSTDDPPSATSIGSACFVACHLMSLCFEDERKDQVMKGLVATLALNSPNSMLSLAINPPQNTKLI